MQKTEALNFHLHLCSDIVDIKQIQIYLDEDWNGYRDTLISILFHRNSLINSITDYLCSNTGKQLRPVMSLLASRIVSGGASLSLSCYYSAALSEIIHNASLLHDDVVDDGDIRRGVPTVKASFGSAASVLSGDYLLTKGLTGLIENCSIEVVYLFIDAVKQLAEGEMFQMELSQTLKTTKEDYYTVIFKKTSALFIAALKGGALSAGAGEELAGIMETYGRHLGNAFQIRDDIFDYSPNLDTGKTYGSDITERKITLPLLCAMENAPAVAKEEIMRKIAAQGPDVAERATEFVHLYNGMELAQKELEEQSALAQKALSSLPSSKEKELLMELASYVGRRNT